MNENDSGVGQITVFGFTLRRLTLIRIAGATFTLTGMMHLAEAFVGNESVIWWKLVLGVASVAFGILLLVARAAKINDK